MTDFAPDSPLVDRITPSPTGEMWDRRGASILGIVIHMAEGGGTDSHLARLDGNSAHYVIKYSGALVQMVPERLAAGSMNPRLTRNTDDAAFSYQGTTVKYGITALRRCLGLYAYDANRVAIAIEIEGFAGANSSLLADPLGGPNDEQEATLLALVRDIRRRRGYLPVFGHRDQQSYKPCPGKRIPWASLGGHAVKPTLPDTSTEASVKIQFKIERWDLDGGPGKVTTLGAPYKEDGTLNWQLRLAFLSGRDGVDPRLEFIPRIRLTNPSDDLDDEFRAQLAAYIDTPIVTPDTTPFSQADLDAAVQRTKESARIVFG